MSTATLLEALADKTVRGTVPASVTGLAYDSRKVEAGNCFVAVAGFKQDGRRFIPDALGRGAGLVVLEGEDTPAAPARVLVPSAREALARLADAYWGHPSRALTLVGITGTNGKTTTSFLVEALLRAAGHRTGLIGTIQYRVGTRAVDASQTTPEALELQGLLAEMRDGGITGAAMEVSSHALALARVSGTEFDAAVFTNLTQDHLDFHDDMESYFRAKRRLFEAGPGAMVVNTDDEYGRRLAAEFPQAVTVGLEEGAQLRATDLQDQGRSFVVDGRRHEACLPGRFNVLNALCAIAACRALGLADDAIADALPQAGTVPGRFQPVDEGQGFTVLVDYSHTPDSLENALRAARELGGGRVYCVFGAGGDRDRDKRPKMGRVAAELADAAIVTSDNPRSEDPQAIVDAILAGMDGHGTAILDRREAIAHAIGLADGDDVVLIAGKGHEQGQELAGGEKVPFDDVAVAREALRDRLVI